MDDEERATCPGCGAPISSDDPAGLCPRCELADSQWYLGDDATASPSSPPAKCRKRRPTLVWALIAICAVLIAGVSFANRLGWLPATASARHNRRNSVIRQRELNEAIAKYRAEIRLKPDDADAHYNLGVALRK